MHITATAPYVANALYYEATDFLYGIAIFIYNGPLVKTTF